MLVMVFAFIVLAACNQREPANIEDPEDGIPPKEAQSDFIDIGKQAGIEWLSFVPNAEREYPSLYQGLDRDQKRRLWLAPAERPDSRLLLHFDLPTGSKIWPVEWYGINLLAIDLPAKDSNQSASQYSVAICQAETEPSHPKDIGPTTSEEVTEEYVNALTVALAKRRRMSMLTAEGNSSDKIEIRRDQQGNWIVVELRGGANVSPIARYSYSVRHMKSTVGICFAIAEWRGEEFDSSLGVDSVGRHEPARLLERITIRRDLAVEGLPKHGCKSTKGELLAGTLKYQEGALRLQLIDNMMARKIGGDSTVQIDGHGAKPWILIRRLSETTAPGDLRVRVRNDAVFQRRLDNPGASFSAGYVPQGVVPGVFWDYRDAGSEHVTLGLLKVGGELLTVEIISTGLRDGEARRKARQAALDLLAGATAEPNTEAPEFQPLVGWNIGTMGRED